MESDLVDEGAAPHARYLAAPDVGHLEVGVQEQVARQGFGPRVVHADIEMQLFFAQN